MKRLVRLLAAFAAFAIPALVALAPSPSGSAASAEEPPLVQAPPSIVVRGASVPVAAVVSGEPTAVTLIANRRVAMSSDGSGVWRAVIPPGTDHYRVDATYPSGHVEHGATQRLAIVERIADARVVSVPAAGTRIAMLRLGRDVGVTDGEQGARILPASFAVNERAGRLDVLDTPNARIASFDLNGRPTGVTPIGTRTASDIVRLPDGTREVLDAVRGRLIDADTSSVRSDTSLRDIPADARLIAHGTELYVRDPAQGDEVPLRGATAAPKELTLDVRDGSIVTAVGTSATRISLERPVLDVVESEIDGRGVLWLLADLDDGTMRLVAIDPLVPAIATVRTVDASVFGDVTRRLVASPDGGVVVMSATTSDLVYTRYGR